MHAHLIEWLRGVHLHPDSKLAEQRWNAAKRAAQGLSQSSIAKLLRLFLYPEPATDDIAWLTNLLLKHDSEFPVTKNQEEIRLIAGIIMVTAFEKSSTVADAFSLGLRAGSFPEQRTMPAHPEILSEADKYLRAEAERMRPSTFEVKIENAEKKLGTSYKAMRDSEAAGDTTKTQTARSAYHKAVAEAVAENNKDIQGQIRRLAEESAMLWWLVGEYSSTLSSGTSALTAVSYALVAASEAADRTRILPPPPSVEALLTRALGNCKGESENAPISEYLTATTSDWCARQSGAVNLVNTVSLVPLNAALLKYVESGDAEIAVKTMVNLCPGVKAEMSFSPPDVAHQFYHELMFLKTMTLLPKG